MIDISPTSYAENIEYDKGCKISHGASVFGGAENKIILGKSVYIGPNSYIEGKHGLISIGDHVSIARNVSIISSSGPNASNKLQRLFPLLTGDITIQNDVWIGSNSLIMPGVKIGEFSVIASNSFVNTDIDAYTVVGGTPARVIRRLETDEIKLLKHD